MQFQVTEQGEMSNSDLAAAICLLSDLAMKASARRYGRQLKNAGPSDDRQHKISLSEETE